jgi:predicted RNase H-like HicB family nuclease
MRYTIILEPEEEGGFHVWCPALKGCHSQGDTKEEALANIQEAMAAYLESLRDDRVPFPDDVITQQVEAAAG